MPRRHTSVVEPGAAPSGVGSPGWRIALVAGALLFGSSSAAAQGLLEWVLGWHHDVQVITNTDLTPAGALLRPASPENPVYYVAISAGYHDLGKAIAGDKMPASEDMIHTVVTVLAKQGYLPADHRHPPTQCIIFTWGSLYCINAPDPWNPIRMDVQLNRGTMMAFLGGTKLGLVSNHADAWLENTLLPGLTRFNASAVAIADLSGDDLYAIVLSGYACPSPQPHKPQLLWRTRVGCPASGLAMADTLPTMMTIAGPYIGRDTKAPVWVNASDKFKPDIRIGNPKVEEYLDSSDVPIFDATTVTANARRNKH